MKFLIVCAIATAALGVTSLAAQRPAGTPGLASPSVVFHLPESFDAAGLQIVVVFRLTGLFNADTASIKGASGIHDYPIEITRRGTPATSMKGYASKWGYSVELFSMDFDPHQPLSQRIAIELKPIGTERLAGHIGFPPRAGAPRVTLIYSGSWHCEYFGTSDCMSGIERVGSAPIQNDGTFVFDVPAFRRDPALTKFRAIGEFYLDLGDENGRGAFTLEQDGKPLGPISVAASYPDLRLVAKLR